MANITPRSGLYTIASQLLIFVQIPINAFADTIQETTPVSIQKNVYKSRIEVSDSGYLIYQFQGNNWTTIEYIGNGYLQIMDYIPQVLESLNSQAVYYEYNDTTESVVYNHYDSSGRLDSFEYTEETEQDFEVDTDPVEYVDRLLKKKEIFAFCGEWSGQFLSAGGLLNVSDSNSSANDFVAFHYLIVH